MIVEQKTSRQDGKLTIFKTELEDWVVEIWATKSSELKVASQYRLLGTKHPFLTCDRLSSAASRSGEAVKFHYFSLQNVLYLHLPLSNDSFHIILSSAAPVIEKIPSLLYSQLVTRFTKDADREMDMKSEIDALKKEVELLEATIQEKDDIIANYPKNALSALRDHTPPDFTLNCTDNVWVGVHRLVLRTFWPFFETLLKNDAEKQNDHSQNQDIIRLDYDNKTVEIFVSYLYGQKVEFDCQQALTLMNMCGDYKLDDLANVAFEVISAFEHDLKLADCIQGWKSARRNGYADRQKFFAKKISEKTKASGKNKSEKLEFSTLTQEETLELFFEAMGC